MNANLHLKAAEQMAGRARECQTTVAELFATAHEISFDTPGHSAGEQIEHTLDITPELMDRAQRILDGWNR